MNIPETITQASDLVPYSDDDDTPKRLYFSWRICGFSKAEAAIRAMVASTTYEAWILDEAFARIEERVPELRLTAQDQIIQIEEDRNRRKLVEVDSKVLSDTLSLGVEDIDKQTFEYLKGIGGRNNTRVKEILGITPGQMPNTFDEILIMVARNKNARNENAQNENILGPPIEQEDYSTTE